MDAKMQVFDAAGALVFDTLDAKGGVVVDFKAYASAATDTLTYPSFSGRAVSVLPMTGYYPPDPTTDFGVTTDTSLGYPRVTVASRTFARSFIVMVY